MASAGAVDQHLVHLLRGRVEKVNTVLPRRLYSQLVGEPQVDLVDERGRRERLAGRFVAELARRDDL
jgi:hypothetical protein